MAERQSQTNLHKSILKVNSDRAETDVDILEAILTILSSASTQPDEWKQFRDNTTVVPLKVARLVAEINQGAHNRLPRSKKCMYFHTFPESRRRVRHKVRFNLTQDHRDEGEYRRKCEFYRKSVHYVAGRWADLDDGQGTDASDQQTRDDQRGSTTSRRPLLGKGVPNKGSAADDENPCTAMTDKESLEMLNRGLRKAEN